jgi:hypothetical protein
VPAERPDSIPPALRRYATVVTWLFMAAIAVLIGLILYVVFS